MNNATVVRFYHGNGYRTGLMVRSGTTWLHIVVMGHPVALVRVPVEDEVTFEFLDESPAKAARQYLNAGTRLGITVVAKRECEDVLKQTRA